MLLRIKNNLDEGAPKTYLTFNEVAGTNIIRWANPNGFETSWGIQIGETGEEQTEVKVISGNPSGGTAGTLTANTSYAHPTNTSVYATKYDQVVFERSTTGTAGTATPMTSGTVTIQADQFYTQFDDTSGSSTYAYKTYFRSSGLAANSTESDWITSSGYDFYSLAKMRERVRDKLWNSDFVDDLTIDNWINEARDKMVSAAVEVNEDYSIGTVNVAFGTAGLGTVTTTDFRKPKRVEVTYNGSDFFLSTKRGLNEYYPLEVVNSAHPYHNWEGNTVFRVMPSDDAGTAKIWYYSTGTPMVNETDTLPLPLRPYTDIPVEYGLIQAQYKDQKISATEKRNLENGLFSNLKTGLTPRDQSSQTYIKVEEVLSGDDSSVW